MTRLVKLCKCGHQKNRHVRLGHNFPNKCLDCNDYHSFDEIDEHRIERKGDNE